MRGIGIFAGLLALVLTALLGATLVPTVAASAGWPGLAWGIDFTGYVGLAYELEDPREAEAGDERACDGLLEALRGRLDRVDAIDEISLHCLGRELRVSMPADDEEPVAIVRSMLIRRSTLELRGVDDALDLGARLAPLPAGIEQRVESIGGKVGDVGYLLAEGPDARERLWAFVAPLDVGDRELVLAKLDDEPGATERWRTYVLVGEAAVVGTMVVDAEVLPDPHDGAPVVDVTFDEVGTQAMSDLSQRFLGHRIAMVVDGEVISAPVVQSRIDGGRVFIALGNAGSFAEQLEEANALASALRMGTLPSLIPIDETIVRPILSAREVLACIASVSLLVLLVGGWRLRARAVALLLPGLVCIASAGALVMLGATVSYFLVLGVLVGAVVALVESAWIATRLPRPLVALAIGVVPLAGVALLGLAVSPIASGPTYGFVFGATVSSVMGTPLAALWALALVGSFGTRAEDHAQPTQETDDPR